MLHKIPIVIFILIVFQVQAQTITEYKPVEVSKDSVYLDEKKFKKTVAINGFEGLPKDAVEEVKDIYYSRKKKFLDNTKNHEYIIDPKLTAYLQVTFNNILSSAGVPDKDSFRLHLTRYFIPNAYNSGDWSVYFNIGLLAKMENESQIAYVLCHEMSHQLLKHSIKHIYTYLKTKYSSDLKKEQKEIAKAQYGTADKLVEVLKKKVYKFTEHSRDDEKSADSLGLLLLMRTNYDATEEIRVLQILDSLEADTFTVNYQKYFDGSQFHFKDSWLEKSKTLSFGGKAVYEFDEDSVKTHPDCPLREQYSKLMLAGYKPIGKQKNIQPAEKLKALTDACKFEEVEYMFFMERYAYCLFHALHLAEEYPNDVYPVTMVSKCLGKISEASKSHKLYDHIAKPAPNFQENYNQLLQLFDRVTLNDINQLNSNYLNNNLNKYGANNSFSKAYKNYNLQTKY